MQEILGPNALNQGKDKVGRKCTVLVFIWFLNPSKHLQVLVPDPLNLRKMPHAHTVK